MSTNEPGNAHETQPTTPLPRETHPTEALPRETRPTEALPKPSLQQIPLTPPLERTFQAEHTDDDEPRQARIGTAVWGLIVIALAALIVISTLGWVTLNGTYVLIGLMIGAGAALVVGGLLSARKGSKKVTTTK
ncbi:hypothetical protein LN996_07770 [Arthrobacter sp. AK01]|uniref:hypothetical protein n=1 Tax=Micrococcaceae TaxID=1268 RepID=UPI001E556FFE|nr:MULTISPECIES: hypothetical protein [Micrococcaceae]MCD4850704.1 hypothetical protein [Arthrobacter sp. AK01]MCP1415002.1 hypothetical protein [Paenarthrobacter sp. A20]